jgi:predicted HTH transcriptional regulator
MFKHIRFITYINEIFSGCQETFWEIVSGERTTMVEWNFISNHGLVLVYIAKHPRSTAREIASAVNVTEWTVHKIISELERDGFVKRKREGRRNAYHVNKNARLRHSIIDHVSVRDFLSLLVES